MIFPYLINFETELSFFVENTGLKQNLMSLNDFSFFYNLSDLSGTNIINLSFDKNSSAGLLLDFINQTEDAFFSDNAENLKTIYHYSIPNTKLAYPEPFIASASMMHSDIWFIHILIYQYWLWFIFVFLIIFFFITFICTVRWCNTRIRPRRETRGVSRSKCGDLITAIVPVSWATSIIVHESTDAIDYYDGFGTSELVVGIRAYQWGWEYYYPKDIDLNYNVKHNYSSFVGNSLKYNTSSDVTLRSNNMWKFYQNKTSDLSVTPAHVLFMPSDNNKLTNFLNFSDVGANPLNESSAFKKTRMFSKVSNLNLISASYGFENRYKSLSYLFKNDNRYPESSFFTQKRQHNFLTSSAVMNNYATFFDKKSFNRWSNFNNFDVLSTKNNESLKNIIYFEKQKSIDSNLDYQRLINILSSQNYKLFQLKKLSYYPTSLSLINDDTDKKKSLYTFFKANNGFSKKTYLSSIEKLSQSFNFLDNIETPGLSLKSSHGFKLYFSFSPNQSILTSSKSLRAFSGQQPNNPTLNSSQSINTLSRYSKTSSEKVNLSPLFFYNLNKTNWTDGFFFNKNSTNRIYFDSPHSPVITNNPFISTLSYDSSKNSSGISSFLQSKEDQLPQHLLSAYWNFYLSNTDMSWRLINDFNYDNLHNKFYIPLFSFYYDYDFRNWQSLELFEDTLWESIYSIYVLDEYLGVAKDFYNSESLDKLEKAYYRFDKIITFKDDISQPSVTKETSKGILNDHYSSYFYIDDQAASPSLTPTNEFYTFLMSNPSIEDSYDSVKFLTYVYQSSFKNLFSSLSTFIPYQSHATVFNSFRSDFDSFSWFYNETFASKQVKNASALNKCLKQNLDFFANNILEEGISFFFKPDSPFFFKSLRFSEYINVRSPIKNSMVTYNALQKVFRARFDEGRSNAKLTDYSNSFTGQNYISSPRLNYERLIGKTKENFFDISMYKNSNLNNFNVFYDLVSSNNFYTYDFPFLLAMKSDASRYLWFDWFAKWGFYEVQPSSSSRYAIHGMPYYNKNFEFSSQIGEGLTESETYFLRIAKARRNYLPSWSYTPFFYAKNTAWYNNTKLFSSINVLNDELNSLENTFKAINWYWLSKKNFTRNSVFFNPSTSNMNSFAKSFWKPQSSIQSYYYSATALTDILSKREYLYRNYIYTQSKVVSLPIHFTNSPSNPLVDEVKSAFFLIDPINYNNEYSRDVYYNSLNFFYFNVLKSYLSNFSQVFNVSWSNYLWFFFFNDRGSINNSNNQELYQNQYRPMKKGITNMIRLHATGAIAMPIEIKLQILASSKDVIHSWAIPSAGIKIDCVPGYSSHKVTIFLVSGIFWGQCMEICGRYHHWMPIVVYFMKRDLFFLWCTHFVFLSGSNNMWSINDRQFVNYAKTASFDKLSWLSEINDI